MTRFTAREKATEARRETELRKRVYPRFVGEGKISGKAADRQIAIMDEIAADYEQIAEADEMQERLL